MKRQAQPVAWGLAFSLLVVLTPLEAAEQVKRCVQADGGVLYTDQPCQDALAPPRQGRPVRDVFVGSGIDRAVLGARAAGLAPLVMAAYLVMSLLCFLAYWRDKRAAIQGRPRTPERRLHLYELLGGWPGGLLAQRLIRHKNRKPAYQLRFWAIVLVHVGGLGFYLLRG